MPPPGVRGLLLRQDLLPGLNEASGFLRLHPGKEPLQALQLAVGQPAEVADAGAHRRPLIQPLDLLSKALEDPLQLAHPALPV